MAVRRWRHYETTSGRRPVGEFLQRLADKDAAALATAMEEVRSQGLRGARHLQGQVYEVRADGSRVIYRLLFAPQGEHGQILLTLAIFKKTQKTPIGKIRLAQQRLREWERRGNHLKASVHITYDIFLLICQTRGGWYVP
jgi:phage-related protein